uniref:TPR_REGION domain-containing protein n=1 Tax=Caenorhabditis tropicalis TaxID=1561998 RepID=A0A1I7V0M2_9PELO
MLKRPNFGFLSNIANDAINKAKEAGSQIQAAVPIKPSTSTSNIVNNNVFSNSKSSTSLGPSAPSKSIAPPEIPMDGLSEEERRQIMSVMAAADFDDSVNNARPSTSGSSNIPAGMDDLSEEERQKIMSVMANAEMEMGPSFPVSSQLPTRSPSVMSTSMMSELPPGIEDLSEEERIKIMSVMAEAEMQDVRQPVMAPKRQPPFPPSTSMIPPGMEGLSEEERNKIMSVMANAEMDTSQSVISSRQPSRSPSVARMQPSEVPSSSQSIPIIPPGLEGLSEEERLKIMSVMADAEFEESRHQIPMRQPSRSSSFVKSQQTIAPLPIPSFQPMPIIPPGLEDLSEEERQKIMSVMMNAEVEESRSQVPSRQPSRSPSFIQMQQPTIPIIPPGLEDLSEAERQKIMSVMAEAEVQNLGPSRSQSSYSMASAPLIPPGSEELTDDERQKIMSVMAKAELDSSNISSRSPSSYSMPPPPEMSYPDVRMGLEGLSEAERHKILSVMAEADMDSAKVPSRSPSTTQMIPSGLENLSEEERQKIMSVMANSELNESNQTIGETLPRGHTGFIPSGSVDEDRLFETEQKQREESPTRESGYATSTSYERELATGGEERMDGLLEDILRIREGARSRRDSRDEILQRREEDPEVHTPEEVPAPIVSVVSSEIPVVEQVPTKPQDDFDFTYSDSRFAEIVKMQEEEESETIEQQKIDDRPRMWETVFDGDESELPHQDFVFNESATKKPSEFDFPKETDEVFEKSPEIHRIRVTKNHDVDMEEIYDNVIATPAPVSKITEKERTKTIQRASSKPPPLIKVTGEDEKDETKSDSDEESCSEEDDEYPDRVVAAPTAPAPSFEEVEKERIRQEELGKEVLQQIQAFGEVANDEFDVQWARTTTSQTPSISSQPIVTIPKRSDPIPIAPSQRSKEIEDERIRTEALEEEEFYRHGHNPFLESPDEDDVSINMEDVEYAEIARMYESANQTMRRPGPVYTITEDESEDDGTLSNSESRMVAREKRLMDRKTADSLMAKYQKMKKIEVKPTTTTVSSTTATATSAYAIINFTDPVSTKTTDSRTYFETTKPIPQILEIRDPKKDIPPEISASIDKTMAEVDALLGQVYTNDKAKPNLLCFDQSKFTNIPPTSTASTSTSDDLILLKNNNSTSPSFLLPLQFGVLGSQLDSVRNDQERNETEATSPRGLKRSPGMLLPSPTSSSSAFPMPPTAAESVGAAIGATTSSMFSGISVSDPTSTMDKLTNSYKWLQNIEDDGNLANNEMGRRKLPSIPPNSSAFPPPSSAPINVTHTSIPSTSSATVPTYVDDYNVTLPPDPIISESLLKGGSLTRRNQQQQQHPAPVYITSSASRPQSAAGNNIFQESRPTSSLSMYQNDVILSRPGSAASNYTSASTVNPTILAGASYSSKSTSHIRQPVSHRPVQTGVLSSASGSVSNTIRSSIGSSCVTARVPNTLARVLLKKELKDVLNQRKQRLEATEIEANQRHYKVQKMLITGLLPEKTDDDIPNIVKCDLPADLIRGVHISMQPPSPAASAFSPRRYHPTPTKRTTVFSSQQPASSSSYKQMSKSIACQADELPPVKPMISLRTQLDMERRPQLMTYVGKRSAETQTEMTNYESITPTARYGSMPRSSRERSASRRYREQQQQIYNQMPQNHNDLLEITKKYFEDYDRQLREFGERARRHSRRRFDFHDDDDQDGMRKTQVMNELARRKERMCASCEVLSTTDPIGTALNQNVPMSSDYSSHIPHYGSLPRIDYPRGTRTDVRDFTYRQQHIPQQSSINYAYNYGSLPRNFERYTSGLPPIEIEHEQSFGAPPRHRSNLGYESTSMFNLSDPAYLGYDSISMMPQQQQPRIYDQIPLGYAQDTTNLNNLNQGIRGSDMVSQYASYLNSQFQSGLQQSAQLPQPMMPITRYDAPMSDPYMSSRLRQMDQMNPSYNQNQYQHHHMTLLAPKPATMTHVAPTYNQLAQQQELSMQNTQIDPLMMSNRIPPTSSQVYSRNEMNYGSRPAQSSLFEYGNRRQYGAAPPPTYDVPSVSNDWKISQGSMNQMSIPMQQNNTFDARWPKEDALSRMYATASRRRAQETALTSSSKISTGSRNYARRPIRPSSYRNPQSTNSMPDRHVARKVADNGRYDIKRILLTRSYKHHNVYNDLGVRVVGGKRQKNGELSAYVSQLHSTANNQTLGQIKIGDEVVEWNGVLLRGKTFEEVERIVNKSHGEIEMVIRTEKNSSSGYYDTLPLNRNTNTLRDDLSPDRVPPVPMHRINGINNNSVLHHHTLSDSSFHGHIQVSLGYDGNSRLVAKIIRARGLKSRDQSRSSPNPFVKVYLLPGRKVSHKRRTRFVDSSCAPEWNQVLEYQVAPHTLNTMFLEFTVCDYQRDVDDLPLGSVQIPLADKSAINTGPRWYPLQGFFDQQPPNHHRAMNGTSHVQSIAAASTHSSATNHHNHNYSEVPPSILYPKGGINARDKPVRHATFNYNPVSLDIGYPAIN